MAKKKSWLSKLKRFFTSDTTLKSEKDKKRRWLFQRLKINRLASLAPPPPPPSPPRLLSPLHEKVQDEDEAEDEQRKHDFTVAIATAAAAEAAVAAAHAAAEAVRITTGAPQSVHKCEDDTQGSPAIIQLDALQSIHEYESEHQELAAIKIQTAYRAHLARKALRALKGLVKLQAIIRGRAVRRQAMATLKCLQSIVSIQSQVCARRSQTLEETCECHDSNQWQELKDKVMKVDVKKLKESLLNTSVDKFRKALTKIESTDQRRWDDSILTKEEANALFLSKKEALLKRERIKEYALSNRKSTDQEQNKANGNLRYWLEQWVDTQLAKREDLEDINSVLSSNPRTQDYGRRQLNYNSTNCEKQYRLEGLVSPISVSRRSFHQKKQCPHGDEDKNSIPSSPGIVPTYMAATQSAKAKARSMSSPKLRPVSFDTYSEGNSPYKSKLSVISSVTSSEVTSSGRIGKLDGFHYRSPSLKGIPGPVKSSRTQKDLSFDSECSLLNWDRYSSFR